LNPKYISSYVERLLTFYAKYFLVDKALAMITIVSMFTQNEKKSLPKAWQMFYNMQRKVPFPNWLVKFKN
jgi:hypothetical protein